MKPTYSAETEIYREKIHAFLAEHLPADWKGIGALGPEEAQAFTEEWRQTLHAHGYLAPNWPKEYGGGGLTPQPARVLEQSFAELRAGSLASPIR